MSLYDVALSGKVSGTFRVIADDPEAAVAKAQNMYRNGVDHDLDEFEVLWAKEIHTLPPN